MSTPAENGFDPAAVVESYWQAGRLDSIYSLPVVREGDLVAERYFPSGRPAQRALIQSATKSITGALVGIAIEDGCLAGLDEPMVT